MKHILDKTERKKIISKFIIFSPLIDLDDIDKLIKSTFNL